MQQRLDTFYEAQIDTFRENFEKVREDYGFDALHDMRVAIKRLRALIILCEKIDPGLSTTNTEGKLRQLFRLSGKMRDAQVQQALVSEYGGIMEVDFEEYSIYLLEYERKSIKKFSNFCIHHVANDFTQSISAKVPNIILNIDEKHLKSAFYALFKELLSAVESLNTDQQHDEHLHEIRRKLKQCNYLLSILDGEDEDLPQRNKLLKKLEKANDLLGKWHDHVIALEFLSRFLKNKNTGETGNFKHFLLLMDQFSEEKNNLHLKIMGLLEKPIGKLFFGQDL